MQSKLKCVALDVGDECQNEEVEETENVVAVSVATDLYDKGRGQVLGRVHVQAYLYLSGGKAQFSNWRQLNLK